MVTGRFVANGAEDDDPAAIPESAAGGWYNTSWPQETRQFRSIAIEFRLSNTIRT